MMLVLLLVMVLVLACDRHVPDKRGRAAAPQCVSGQRGAGGRREQGSRDIIFIATTASLHTTCAQCQSTNHSSLSHRRCPQCVQSNNPTLAFKQQVHKFKISLARLQCTHTHTNFVYTSLNKALHIYIGCTAQVHQPAPTLCTQCKQPSTYIVHIVQTTEQSN